MGEMGTADKIEMVRVSLGLEPKRCENCRHHRRSGVHPGDLISCGHPRVSNLTLPFPCYAGGEAHPMGLWEVRDEPKE